MCWTCAGICGYAQSGTTTGHVQLPIASGSRRRAQGSWVMSATRGLRGTSGSSMRKAVRNGAQRRPRPAVSTQAAFVVPDAVSFTSFGMERHRR